MLIWVNLCYQATICSGLQRDLLRHRAERMLTDELNNKRFHSRIPRETYVRDKRGFQHAGFQSLEVDRAEDWVSLHLRGTSLTAQPLVGVFGQKLWDQRL